jgi:hypothetical protein
LNDGTLLYNVDAIKNMEDYDIYKYLNVTNHTAYKDIFDQENIFLLDLAYNMQFWDVLRTKHIESEYNTNLNEAIIKYIN